MNCDALNWPTLFRKFAAVNAVGQVFLSNAEAGWWLSGRVSGKSLIMRPDLAWLVFLQIRFFRKALQNAQNLLY
ncbi:hypothetical protein D6779_07605 [Candidatus Parcubacteria bacterium]|nr:MAG: hypothetical protein D6779_07605 [Candidatus Parcubacteria bacterium]